MGVASFLVSQFSLKRITLDDISLMNLHALDANLVVGKGHSLAALPQAPNFQKCQVHHP